MARKLTLSAQDKQHLKNLLRQAQTLRDIFGTASDKAVAIGAATGFCDPNGEFRFDKFPAVKERVQKLFQGLHEQLTTTITEGNRREWLLSEAKNNAMVEKLCKRAGISTDRAKEWLQPNMDALEAFQGRKERGMGLSDRVWRLIDQFKGELEMALELGLGDGKSATDLSRDVREYLNEPHKLFRRVRNEKGQLRLSKSAAAYNPGQGVYRSSYKNALRLTTTENNMAYRTADHERWQQLDFVIGIEILLSNNHPCEDICDELAGVYPKTFKFVGWHPFCRCIAVPKLADEDEFIERQQALIDGKDVPEEGYSGEVTECPEAFNNWVQNNAERIENAKNVPYFIRDNATAVTKALQVGDNEPHYGAAMKLGRSAAKEAMKTVESIGAPSLTEAQQKNIRELADAIGIPQKGIKPMSFLDADQGASNPTKNRENCQSVVVAFEARRRGLDCYALPYSDSHDSASFALGERFQDAWINPKTGKVIEPTILKGASDSEIITKLKRQLNADGRYLLGINEKSGRGHLVSIECMKGKIIIKDEQQNDFILIDSLEDISYLELLRIDKSIFNIKTITSILGFM